MMIMGCDSHTRYQQIAMMDGERYVNHTSYESVLVMF